MINPQTIESIVRAALEEDFGREGDITSKAIIPAGRQATAMMRARKAGVIAGVKVAETAFRLVDPTLEVKTNVNNGDKVAYHTIMSVRGAALSILAAERVALNFITHLSGIATITRKYCDIVTDTGTIIRCTRKTTPGLRALEKEAVRMGGGQNHRFGLYDSALIKDNHLKVAKSIKEAISDIKARIKPGTSVEIEADTLEQLAEVLECGGVDMILLDNMDVATLKKAVEMNLEKTGGKIPLEASGGVTLENVRAIAETGVNYIAVGALTHSAPALDIGLDIEI